MIPRFRPALGWRELVAALSPPGPDDIERFECAFADEMEQKHAVAFPYGRTALMLTLEALGLKDREIICPAYTCVVVPHAIVYSGNRPVFIDCRTGEFNMDLDAAEVAITERTGAIIATSIFGIPVDLDRLDTLRAHYPGIPIIQDCAHSFAAEWRGRPVQKAGIAAIYGLNISKIITSIFGGIVTTDDGSLAFRLRALREARLTPATWTKSLQRLLYLLAVYPAFWPPAGAVVDWLERKGLLARFTKYYDEQKVDMPPDYLLAMTKVEARVGRVQVSKYRRIIKERQAAAAFWQEKLACQESLMLPAMIEGATYSHFACRVSDKAAWRQRWRRRGIQLGEVIEYSVPHMSAYQQYCQTEFPMSLMYSRSVLNFPILPLGELKSKADRTGLLGFCDDGTDSTQFT